MKSLILPPLTLLALLAACIDSDMNKQSGDRLLEDPEHHIKDSPGITKHDSSVLYTGWYYISDTNKGYKRQLDRTTDTFYIDPNPILEARHIKTIELYEGVDGGQQRSALSFFLNEEGRQKWSIATQKAIGRRLAFIIDNTLIYTPMVASQITGGVAALNRGTYSRQELENFKRILESER